jgi:hypothetical protein
MYPERLSPDKRSAAERTLYGEFARQLPPGCTVLHGVKWVQRDPRERDQDGETDFLILDPARGALVLEVKGGSVRRDGAAGAFYSVDRAGRAHPIKDPMEQAMSSKHALKRKLAGSPSTAVHLPRLRLEHAVALPDVVVEETNLGPDWDRGKLLDSTDLRSLETGVQRALGQAAPRWRLEPEAVDAVVRLLAPTWRIERPGLLGEILPQETRCVELTKQQFQVLDLLSAHRRYAVAGCAGSGKTFLAIEQTRRLAREGQRVLFTCFNRALADWVRSELEAGLGAADTTPYVENYHDMGEELCRRAGIALPDPAAMPEEEKTLYYDEGLPARLSKALGALPATERFDAVLVDEAQDFKPGWWVTLLDALRDPDHGRLYIFYDSNQRIYVPDAEFPIEEPHFRLGANLRNTRSIHELAMRYHSDPASLRSLGLEGRPPELIPVEQGQELRALRKVVTRLLGEGLAAEDIVVLTPRSRVKSALAGGAEAGNGLRLTWDEAGAGKLRVRNVHAFKGLEAPVVILAEPDRAHPASREKLLYVALSRARNHLVVLGELSA